MNVRVMLLVVAGAMGGVVGGWLLARGPGLGDARPTALSAVLPPLMIEESLHLAWWSCPPAPAGSGPIVVINTPVRLRYAIDGKGLLVSEGAGGLRVELRDVQLENSIVPETFRENLRNWTALDEAGPQVRAEVMRAQVIASHVGSQLLHEPDSPLRQRLEQALRPALETR